MNIAFYIILYMWRGNDFVFHLCLFTYDLFFNYILMFVYKCIRLF